LNYPGGRVRRRRSHRRRRRMRRTIAVLAALGFLVLAARSASFLRTSWRSFTSRDSAELLWPQGDLSRNLSLLAARAFVSPLANQRRVVYPYSVIPGGVRTPDDLRELSEHDPLIREHYAGFDYQHARIIELDQPRLMYVSYRMHGRVFWMRKPISLRKGERLITDGKMMARARCANRVSQSAQKGTSPEEPPAGAFETPFLGSAGTVPFPNVVSSLAPHEFPGQGVEGPPGLLSSNTPLGGGFPPLFPPPIPSGSCPPLKKTGSKTQVIEESPFKTASKNNPCSPVNPPPVPEPGTILLVTSGIVGIYWRKWKRV